MTSTVSETSVTLNLLGTILVHFRSSTEMPRIARVFGETRQGATVPGAQGKSTTRAMPETGIVADPIAQKKVSDFVLDRW